MDELKSFVADIRRLVADLSNPAAVAAQNIPFSHFDEQAARRSADALAESLKKETTKLAVACKAPVKRANVASCTASLKSACSTLALLASTVPPTRGRYLVKQVHEDTMNVLNAVVHLGEALQKHVRDGKDQSHLAAVGIVWKECDAIKSDGNHGSNSSSMIVGSPWNARDAVLKQWKAIEDTLEDALEEVDQLLQRSKKRAVVASDGTAGAIESVKVGANEDADAEAGGAEEDCEENVQAPISSKHHEDAADHREDKEKDDDDEYREDGDEDDFDDDDDDFIDDDDWADMEALDLKKPSSSAAAAATAAQSPASITTAMQSLSINQPTVPNTTTSTKTSSSSSPTSSSKKEKTKAPVSQAEIDAVQAGKDAVQLMQMLMKKIQLRILSSIDISTAERVQQLDGIYQATESLLGLVDDVVFELAPTQDREKLDVAVQKWQRAMEAFVGTFSSLAGAEHAAWFDMWVKQLATKLSPTRLESPIGLPAAAR